MNIALWHFCNSIAADLKKAEDQHTKRIELDEEVQDIFLVGVAGIRPNDQFIINDTDIENVPHLNTSDKEDPKIQADVQSSKLKSMLTQIKQK